MFLLVLETTWKVLEFLSDPPNYALGSLVGAGLALNLGVLVYVFLHSVYFKTSESKISILIQTRFLKKYFQICKQAVRCSIREVQT